MPTLRRGDPWREAGVLRELSPDCPGGTAWNLEASGLSVLQQLKAEGLDPTHGGKAAERRGAAIAEQKRQAAEWDQANPGPADPELFRREILPLIQGVPLRRLAEATGHHFGTAH
jgi:hypothetical protein